MLVPIAVCHRRLKSTTHRHSLNSSSPGHIHHSITLAHTVLWIHEHCRRVTQRSLDVQLDDRLHRIAPFRNSPPHNSTDRTARSRVIEISKAHGNIAHLSPSHGARNTLHRSSTQRTHSATRQPHGSHTAVTQQSLSSHSAVTQQSLSSHPATRQPHGSHTAVTQRTHTAVTRQSHGSHSAYPHGSHSAYHPVTQQSHGLHMHGVLVTKPILAPTPQQHTLQLHSMHSNMARRCAATETRCNTGVHDIDAFTLRHANTSPRNTAIILVCNRTIQPPPFHSSSHPVEDLLITTSYLPHFAPYHS